MAESDKANSLSEEYLLKDNREDKVDVVAKPVEKSGELDTVEASPEEAPVTANVVEPSSAVSAVNEIEPVDTAAEEKVVSATENAEENVTPPTTEEDAADEGNTVDETPEIKLETAPGDYRFPTTNQSRHCFTRYVEYHRCVAAKGEDASECDKFAKYYRSLCPGEWIDRWNEQRENGTFPGPL